jgi:hypothetical protein
MHMKELDGADREEPALGTLSWAVKTGGALSYRDKLRVLRNLAFIQAREFSDILAHRVGLLRPTDIPVSALAPPDSRLVKDAERLAIELQEPGLLSHSYRVYYLGALIASYDRLAYDRELLCGAAMLHDIALVAAAKVTPEECCFAVAGARHAQDYLVACGHAPARSAAIAEAIALHLNLHVPAKQHGPEAFLLSRGAVCDVFGAGRRRIGRRTLSQLLAQYPRERLAEVLRFESRHAPGSRPDFLSRLGGRPIRDLTG